MTTTMKRRLQVLGLLACLIAVGWLDDPRMYEPQQPGPNAPAYINWRTGEVVQP